MDNLGLRLKSVHCLIGLILVSLSGIPFASKAQIPVFRVQLGDSLLDVFDCLNPNPPYDEVGKTCYSLPGRIRIHEHFPETAVKNDGVPFIMVLFKDDAEKLPQELSLYVDGQKAGFRVVWYSDFIRIDTEPASGFVVIKEKKIEEASFPFRGHPIFPISVGVEGESMFIQIRENYTIQKSDGSISGPGMRPWPFRIVIGLDEFSIEAINNKW